MAMDSIQGEHTQGTVVIVARDAAGRACAFLHFVPSYGRRAMSLSFMRREQELPNGLMEYLVVRTVELLREEGVEELSLNFAAFGRFLRAPTGRRERALGRLLKIGDRRFQIESLYRFNAKFFPRWAPRYFMFEGFLAFPRAALAVLWAEGQIPKPTIRAGRRKLASRPAQATRSPQLRDRR